MSEYVDVVIIENGKKIGSFKAERITKEKAEKKDEIKNKISMALKDPILQQGFEIICKNLSELEKENAELKDKLNNLASVAEVRLANWQKYEKENTELKYKLEHRNCVDCSNHGSNIKLLKAKEIIKKIENIFYSGEDALKRLSQISDILKEAEAFLEEV